MSTLPNMTSPKLTSQGQVQHDSAQKYVPRASQACQMCRQKKTKCDQGRPQCSFCKGRGYHCTYENVKSKRTGDGIVEQYMPREHPSSVSNLAHNPHDAHQHVQSSPTGLWYVTGRGADSSESSLWETSNLTQSDEVLPTIGPEQSHEAVPQNSSRTRSRRRQSDLDPVGGINEHTHGTEFYGTSSNFALLNQLLSKARSRLHMPSTRDPSFLSTNQTARNWPNTRSCSTKTTNNGSSALPINEDRSEASQVLKNNQVSVVNFLFDEESAEQESASPSQGKTSDSTAREPSISPVAQHVRASSNLPGSRDAELDPHSHPSLFQPIAGNKAARPVSDHPDQVRALQRVEIQLEKEYMRVFFDNLHYIHPFLSPIAFASRCDREIFSRLDSNHLRKSQVHFFALYNAVIAVGALTAGTDLLSDLRHYLRPKIHNDNPEEPPSSVDLSKIYFQRAKKFLGDYFEVGSLESVQALILMSLYCQNALRPHACYMYSGMAVRTALAIGLPDEGMSEAVTTSDEARKTWWAVYSQEVDMCCSSGRRSSLMDPQAYPIDFPVVKEEGTASPIVMISTMVHFASILLRISRQIYHQTKNVSPRDTSRIALELDNELGMWKSNLPHWLNSDSHAFKEPEWAGKQRIVLQLRFYNAKILIHRPLMVASDVPGHAELQIHTEACLEGARRTIELLYESYTHRHYFRTWYYNSTYTLYASMLILSVIITNSSHIPSNELIRDVEKSLSILHAMENVKVALRCANLIREVLEVARRQLQNTKATSASSNTNALDATFNSMAHPSNWAENGLQSPTNHNNSMLINTSSSVFSPPDELVAAVGEADRNELLASLMDPIALEGFASDMIPAQLFASSMDWTEFDSTMWMGFNLP